MNIRLLLRSLPASLFILRCAAWLVPGRTGRVVGGMAGGALACMALYIEIARPFRGGRT